MIAHGFIENGWVLAISPVVEFRIDKPNILLRLFIRLLGWRIKPKSIYEGDQTTALWLYEWPNMKLILKSPPNTTGLGVGVCGNMGNKNAAK